MLEEKRVIELDIPIRSVSTYMTDDGRKVDLIKKIDSIKDSLEINKEDKDPILPKLPDEFYVGVAIVVDDSGPVELKFLLDAQNINEAFKKYTTEAGKAAKNYALKKKQVQEERAKNQGQAEPAKTEGTL